jgi:hypothetical protein
VNVVTGYDLVRSYPTNDGDHARGCDPRCRLTRSALIALSHMVANVVGGVCCGCRRCRWNPSCLLS